jgi:AraC-like DNA-binding protein
MNRSTSNAILKHFPDRYLWDFVDDVGFWVKDCDSCFVWVNNTLLAQAGATRQSMLGTRDSDWFLNELASIYVQDDATVISTGNPIINKAELVIGPYGDISWHRTSKFPLKNARGKVIATFGSTRRMDHDSTLPQVYADLAKVIKLARENTGSCTGVTQLAEQAGVSVSTLERLINKHLRVNPRELLLRIRMNRARHLLVNSTLAISAVAELTGYESLSSFSRAFKLCFNKRPGEYRRYFKLN